MRNISLLSVLLILIATVTAQTPFVSDVWVADQGDGTFKNPILYADYSDPDVIRVGDDFYMTASSFNAIPGLPILHSKDLVNWELIGHALDRQMPYDHYSKPQHGNGVWAPSMRYHNNEFYIYYGDPDFGIYMLKAEDPAGPWSKPHLVQGGKGLIDPSPLWDDDGRAYLVYAYAGSRAGIKSILVVSEMSPCGTHLLNEGKIVFDGHEAHETIEGPKFYKWNGYYYIFAPAGGVTPGWQEVLRSKNVYGPYENRTVMHQGNTNINGPHQGGWVQLDSGEHWFIHFQCKDAYGRITHLNPMIWNDGWPIIGIDNNGDGIGEPVSHHRKPNVGGTFPIVTPPDSDEFDNVELGLQWQWHANPKNTWAFINPGTQQLRLFSDLIPEDAVSYYQVPNLLLQKFPGEAFTVETKMTFNPNENKLGERAGVIVMGRNYASFALEDREDGIYLVYNINNGAQHGEKEKEVFAQKVDTKTVYLRIKVGADFMTEFSYSTNGRRFRSMDTKFRATRGHWIGAKVGVFCTRQQTTNDSGFADFDYFRFSK
ncbi:glycoside hydrolase family 43 protein [Natronoflexus pectinivorans]|uniref:Beta-xylosidase n=1 Tax=Natronoflexus pectinivorans TaxID=682526 RepID=A0A4V2RWC4_9BACT|nr:glycoside hydrolase 43 family protein [Natronoflexus pectinivorans]TCO07715.1 beta-xylosidase [Natronoflexus pectinivorans]